MGGGSRGLFSRGSSRISSIPGFLLRSLCSLPRSISRIVNQLIGTDIAAVFYDSDGNFSRFP